MNNSEICYRVVSYHNERLLVNAVVEQPEAASVIEGAERYQPHEGFWQQTYHGIRSGGGEGIEFCFGIYSSHDDHVYTTVEIFLTWERLEQILSELP